MISVKKSNYLDANLKVLQFFEVIQKYSYQLENMLQDFKYLNKIIKYKNKKTLVKWKLCVSLNLGNYHYSTKTNTKLAIAINYII